MMHSNLSPVMTKTTSDALQTASVQHGDWEELFITASPRDGDVREMFARACQVARDRGATIVSQNVFAAIQANGSAPQYLLDACGTVDWPVTWIDSGHRRGSDLAGTQVHAVTARDVERIERDGRILASTFSDDHARYCWMGDLRAADTTVGRPEQAHQTFDLLEKVLHDADMDFSHLVRTWLYLDELLDWYDPFNKVRTAFFNARGVFDRLVPASTGISGANPAGAAMIASALATESRSDAFSVAEVLSPLQCPAPKYGSSFSRAIELTTPTCRRLSVSGTASIEPGGETVHLDNIDAQIDLTVRVIHAILGSRGMSWDNVTKAIAYLKDAKDIDALQRYYEANGLAEMPFVFTENHVCRDNLLVEMELDAVSVSPAFEA